MVTRPMRLDTPVDYAERSGAAFLPTIESHVIVPFMEALISGLFAALFAGVVVFLVANTVSGFVDVPNFGLWVQFQGALIVALIAGFVVSWLKWDNHLDDYKSLLWYTEFAEGPVTESKQTHRAEVKINHNWVHADLPFDRDNPKALADFAAAVVSGLAPFSERGAGRYGYSVARFNELRDGFIKGHLAHWKNPRNRREGIGLSRSGIALLRSVAENPPPPDYEPSEDNDAGRWGMSPEIIQK
jgi:hypothetical protein